MSIFSRWSRQKENLAKREEQRQQSKTKGKPEEETKEALSASAAVEASVEPIAVKSKKPSRAHFLLLKPLVTEKSSYLQGEGVYCFAVHPQANKTEIKKAVEVVFGVQVIRVRIINCKGKKVRYGRQGGRRKNWKKAFVTLKSGQKIEIHKNV